KVDGSPESLQDSRAMNQERQGQSEDHARGYGAQEIEDGVPKRVPELGGHQRALVVSGTNERAPRTHEVPAEQAQIARVDDGDVHEDHDEPEGRREIRVARDRGWKPSSPARDRRSTAQTINRRAGRQVLQVSAKLDQRSSRRTIAAPSASARSLP